MNSTWNKAKHFLAPSVKILVLVACILFLYFQWKERPLRLESVLESLKNLPFHTITLILLLSLASWLVESKKWQLLVRDVEDIRFRESVTQSLTAQAASFITPLRAGEFVFKSLFFKKEQHKEILSRVLIGNLCQMTVTVILGFIGLSILLKNDIDGVLFFGFVMFLLGCLGILGLLWIQKKWNISQLAHGVLWKTLGLSLVRYILFAGNWLLLLSYLKSDLALHFWLDKIAVNYLAVSAVPMFQIADIPVKWTAASYIFNGSTYQAEFIIMATTIIWITNTLFPTLLGCVLLPFKKLKT